MKNFIKNYWAMCIPLVILLIAILFLIKRSPAGADQVIGMVDADFVDVAAEFPGRLDTLLVKQGDTVKVGQLLGILKTTEINAVKQQALSSIQAAQSNLDLLKNGPRTEVIKSAQNLYQIAKEQYTLAEKTYRRLSNLYEDSIVSGQEKDMMFFKYQAAKKEMETAELRVQMLEKGSRPEILSAATAILDQAEQGYALTKAIADNTKVYAPASGIISTLVISQGEIVSIGYPMMTIQKDKSYFVRFNIRQSAIKSIQEGSELTLDIPGCEPEMVKAIVSKVAPALEFANWVPEQASGQFELRTFTVQCVPTIAVKGLRPGMTAALKNY